MKKNIIANVFIFLIIFGLGFTFGKISSNIQAFTFKYEVDLSALFISLLGLAATLYIGIQIPQQLNSILSKKQGLQNRLINHLDSLENELAASYILVNAAHIDKKAWKKISEHLDNCGKILTKTEKMIKISYKKEKHLINLQNSIENFESFITNFHSNVSITLDNKREMKKLYENAQNDVIRSLELIYRL